VPSETSRARRANSCGPLANDVAGGRDATLAESAAAVRGVHSDGTGNGCRPPEILCLCCISGAKRVAEEFEATASTTALM
jgi:hypothetical protein